MPWQPLNFTNEFVFVEEMLLYCFFHSKKILEDKIAGARREEGGACVGAILCVSIEAYGKTYNKAEIDGFAIAILIACEGGHFTRVAILSAHINELRIYYQCAVPLGAGFLSVTFFS